MAENTIDTLSLQIESDAKKSFQSIDRLTSSLIGLSKATDRLNAKGLGTFAQDLKTFSSAVRGLKNVTIPDFSGIASSFAKLNGIRLDTASINNVAKSLKGLASVDMGKFNSADFSQITSSVGQLANIPDVSNSLNRFVSSLQKLANAGDKIVPVANELPVLGNSLRNVVNTMAGAATVSEATNMFTQSIGRLASAGGKTSQTAAGLDALAEKTKDFFASMQNAPQVSENTIRMTQALAQLASAGGNVGKATDSISSGFSRLSSVSSTLSNTVSKVASAVTKAAKKMVSAFAQIGNSSKHVKTASFNLGTLLKTALGYRALRGIFNFGKEAVEFSSDLTEVQNIVDVTFGNMAYKLEDLAKTSISSFGMSELTLKQIASRYQAMGSAMGFSQSKMSDMSIELTKLAADMASFYNVEQDAVAEDLAAIFTGQTRPLRQYGLDLTQATLAEWAMKNGLDSNIQSMSQLEKTMLRYQYVLANTGAAQGDFARTAGTWANQTRILKQNIQQLGGVIGQGLIAALLPGIKVLNTLMSGLTKVATLFRDFMYVLTGKKFEPSSGGFTTDFGDMAEDMSDVSDASGGVADGLDDASDSAKKLKKNLDIADYDELRVLKKDADDLSKSLGKVGGGGLGDLGGADTGMDADGGIEDWLKNSNIIQPINEWASKIRDAFLNKDWERLGSTLAKGLNKGLKKVYDALDWKKVGKKITGFTDGVTRTFNSFVDNFDWDLLGRTIGQGINTGVNTLTQLIEGTDWKNLGRKFASGVNGLFDEVDWGNLGNLIGDKFMIAWNIFSGFVEDLDFAEVGRSFADLLSGAFEKIDLSTIGTSLAKAVNGAFKALLNFTRNFKWDDLRKNVSNGINDTLKTLDWKKAGQSLNEFLLDLGNFMLGVAEDVDWEAFGKGIGDFLSQIDWKTHFLNFLSILKEVLGGIWSGLGDTSAGKFVQGIVTFKIGTKLMPFVNGIVKFFVSQAVIKKLSGGFQKMFGDSISEGATEAGKNIQGKDLFNKLKINSTLFNAGLSNMFTEDVSRILKGESVAEEGNREMAINLVSGAANKAGKESGISWLDRVQISNSWRNFLTGEIPSLEEALDKIITKYTEAGGSVDALKTQITTALSENKTISQEYATAIEEYIGGTGDTFTTTATEYETASTQMQTATSGISGMLQSISDNSWGADQQLSLVAGALQSLYDKGLLSNPQLSTLSEMLLNAQSSGGGLSPILQDLSDELYNAGINAPTFFDALKDGSYYVGDKLPSDFSTFIGSLQNVKTEADNASTATSNVGTTANNSVTNLLSFIAQAALMAGGLGSIKTGSEEAGTKISELSGNIVNFVNGLATNAQTIFDEGKNAGENYPSGFAQGIEGKNQDVKDASQEMVDTATDTVKTGLDINSPSGVAKGFGENYGQGLINGIKAKLTDLGTAMDSVIDKLEKPFDNLAQNFQTVGKNLMVSLQNGINSQHISLPRISVSWTKYFMGNSQFSIPNFSLSYLAKGGLITDEMLAVMGENRRKEAVLPLENQKTMSMIADAIVDRMPQRLDIGNIEINRSQAPYVTTANIPRSTYSDSFGDDMRRDIAAISSNTFNNNTNIGQAVKDALNGMAVVADGYIIGYLQSKNMESRNQNGGLGLFEV